MSLKVTLKVLYEHLTRPKRACFGLPHSYSVLRGNDKDGRCGERPARTPAERARGGRPRITRMQGRVRVIRHAAKAHKWKRRQGSRPGGVMDDMQ
jgi:hypothetical protein